MKVPTKTLIKALPLTVILVFAIHLGVGLFKHASPREFGDIVPPDPGLYSDYIRVERVVDGKSAGSRGSRDIDKIYQFLNRFRNYTVNSLVQDKYDRSDYYEVTVSPTDGRYIHICFYGDEYISVYKGEGFEYYKLVDGKTDLNYLKEFFDSLEDLEKPVSRPVIKPRNPALDFVQGMREDMDSDGILEEITLECDGYNDLYRLGMNNLSITAYGDNIDRKIELVDMDAKDGIKEIAVPESGPSGDYAVSFYYYTPQCIVFMGKVEGSFYDGKVVIDGDGTVKGQTRGHILHTWFYEDTYRLTGNHMLENIPPPDGLYSMSNYKVRVKESIPIYRAPDGEKLVDLTVGEEVTLLATDDKEKVLLETSHGKKGWIMVESYSKIKGTSLQASDVFEGLNNAD